MRRTLTTLLALTTLLVAPTSAFAGPGARQPPADTDGVATVEPTTAEDWLRLGLSRYESGDFTGAVDAFVAGHAIEPRAAFLFAIAQAERRRGDCAAAIHYYDQFLVTSPAPEQEAAAIDQRDRCQQVLDAAAQPEPEPEPAATPERAAAAAPAPTPRPPAAPAAARPGFWRDPLTLGLGGSAAVAALVGVGLLLSADSAATAATTAATYDQHATLRDRAESRSLYGTIALSAGVVLAGATVLRILQVSRRDPTESPRRAVHLDAGPGLGLALGGSF